MEIENIFAEIEFEEEMRVYYAVCNAYGEDCKKILSTKWAVDGKYRFDSYMIVLTPEGEHLKLSLSMFGNNPRDDFQYVEVVKMETVKRVEKITYDWESI